MGVKPDMSTSSTPGSNAPDVKFAASMNQLLIMFTVNSLQQIEYLCQGKYQEKQLKSWLELG